VWIKLVSDTVSDFSLLKRVSYDFEEYLKNINWTKNIITSSVDSPGQFIFTFIQNKLETTWLNRNDILNELYLYTNGINVWSIKSKYEDNNIIVSLKEFENFISPEDIENLIINTKIWKIRVGDFVKYSFEKSVNTITRENNKIIISVWSELEKDYLPTDIQPLLNKFALGYNFPSWINYIESGEWEDNKELIISTIKSLFISLFLIFTILVYQLNSFKQPFIVLYSIILALLGVNIGLYLTWNPYSMPFAIWFIALTWIVVNDAIILMDRINKTISLKKEKISSMKSIISASKSRLQPIIVTTLTTIFWILPLALTDEFWAGLGYTIIFWLFVWSFMTLFVIPILYNMFIIKKIRKK
jgi:multidrug efflux pump subunit AcrB